MKNVLLLVVGLNVTIGAAFTSQALTIGQVDDFEDGTSQNWVVALIGAPHPAPPINVASGGPGGAADNFLRLTSLGGSGPGSKLSAINFSSQWAGDYLSAGMALITMDVRNSGSSDLSLRLSFSDPIAGPPSNVAFSDDAIFVPAGSGWMSIAFPLQDLTAGLGNVDTALQNTTELRIYHSTIDTFPGSSPQIEAIAATLDVDNIRARGVTVPDGGSAALMLALPITALLLLGRKDVINTTCKTP